MSSRDATRAAERRRITRWLTENGYPDAAAGIDALQHHVRVCVKCGESFTDVGRGRPPLRCERCRRRARLDAANDHVRQQSTGDGGDTQ